MKLRRDILDVTVQLRPPNEFLPWKSSGWTKFTQWRVHRLNKLTNSFLGKTANASTLRRFAEATIRARRVDLEKAIVELAVNVRVED